MIVVFSTLNTTNLCDRSLLRKYLFFLFLYLEVQGQLQNCRITAAEVINRVLHLSTVAAADYEYLKSSHSAELHSY